MIVLIILLYTQLINSQWSHCDFPQITDTKVIREFSLVCEPLVHLPYYKCERGYRIRHEKCTECNHIFDPIEKICRTFQEEDRIEHNGKTICTFSDCCTFYRDPICIGPEGLEIVENESLVFSGRFNALFKKIC